MQPFTPRFGQIVFWEEHELEELHRRERERYAKSEKSVNEGHGALDWEDWEYFKAMAMQHGLVPYFPRQMTETERGARVDEFLDAIKPIYWNIHKRCGQDMSDCEITHKMDVAVWKSKKQPNRGVSDGFSLEKARRANQGQYYE